MLHRVSRRVWVRPTLFSEKFFSDWHFMQQNPTFQSECLQSVRTQLFFVRFPSLILFLFLQKSLEVKYSTQLWLKNGFITFSLWVTASSMLVSDGVSGSACLPVFVSTQSPPNQPWVLLKVNPDTAATKSLQASSVLVRSHYSWLWNSNRQPGFSSTTFGDEGPL